ncbi:MAG: ribosomal protein S18-alanine N-acetyltransferase [Bacillota bacterium]
MEKIREMNVLDIRQVIEIEKKCFEDCWSIDAFVYEIMVNKNSYYYVYQKDGIIIAFIGSRLFNKHIHITNLAVDPENQNKGIATELINHIILIAKNKKKKKVCLEVRYSNKKAINLYKKLGFIITKKLLNYYKHEDGIEMVLNIK